MGIIAPMGAIIIGYIIMGFIMAIGFIIAMGLDMALGIPIGFRHAGAWGIPPVSAMDCIMVSIIWLKSMGFWSFVSEDSPWAPASGETRRLAARASAVINLFMLIPFDNARNSDGG